MNLFSKILFTALCFLFSIMSQAVTVQDSQGTFTLDYVPKRIVVLEFSFVDALASINVSPIGIADDKDKTRIIKQVKDIVGDWQSVGTRSQPSLEVIASLNPDLIIADFDRHAVIYEDLNKIAPTLILPSRRVVYQKNIEAAIVIGEVLGKSEEMQARLAQHKDIMAGFAKQLPQNIEVQFGVAQENYISMHPGKSYVGSVIQSLGIATPAFIKDQKASVHTGLEQLLAINPQYLIIGHYGNKDIVNIWENEYLWGLLRAVQNKQVYHTNDPNVWSRARGTMAAEVIAQELVRILGKEG
ncbi:MAG: Fe(3+) dicitrate ABC transporter substrate-binding protein [Marinomonas colpomeniae]